MKPIETRVTEGLRTFADGITMDVLDTERAHRDLFERIDVDRSRRHRTLTARQHRPMSHRRSAWAAWPASG